MREEIKRVKADVLVIGSGLAGMTAAIGVDGFRVHMLTKGSLESGSSPMAQGGVAAAVGVGDSPELHAADTISAGAGLVDPEVARIVARDGVVAINGLIEVGARFDRGEGGELSLHREGAHSRHRIVHARGDATGAELVRLMISRLRENERVEIFERAVASRLIVAEGRVVGALAFHRDLGWVVHSAPRVVLATGGLGQLYRHTTNPAEATGDGLLLAAEAGAKLVDVEFVQFHPTALAIDADPLPLLTEALRGEGAVLVDHRGERFMSQEHPAAELAPRDVVARAISERLMRGTGVFLDARAAIGDRFPTRFPTAFAACRVAGIDPRVERIPVVPAAHYFMGGVAVDAWGRASIDGLWACGEVACTGVHGANRLASNSLLEALVFGARVARSAGSTFMARLDAPANVERAPQRGVAAAPNLRSRIRALATEKIAVIREGAGLVDAARRFEEIWDRLPRGHSEERSLAMAGTLVAAAALRRKESRGAHYRSDYPETSEAWCGRQVLRVTIGLDAIEVDFESANELVTA